MKYKKNSLIIAPIIILLFSCNPTKKQIKSIYKSQNDTLISIQLFDSTGKLYFDKNTSIEEEWDHKLFTRITTLQFDSGKLKYEYGAKSNSGFTIKKYDFDQIGNTKGEYVKHHDPSDHLTVNPYSYIYNISTPDSLISYINSIMPDSIEFTKQNYFQRRSQDYFKEYIDSTGLKVKEYWTIEDSIDTHKIIEKYDDKSRMISKYVKTLYNEGIDKLKYDDRNNLIEELEVYDLESGKFQRKEHTYNNNNLLKTLLYHGTLLAYKYEYFYKNELLAKEIKTRITNTEHFQRRRWKEEYIYRYEFY